MKFFLIFIAVLLVLEVGLFCYKKILIYRWIARRNREGWRHFPKCPACGSKLYKEHMDSSSWRCPGCCENPELWNRRGLPKDEEYR